jgi:transcriptional regulator
MYIPNYFKIQDEATVFDLIERFSFATIVSQHNGQPAATHLPLLLNRGERVLHGHFAHANEQWKDSEGQELLVLFQGPHSYISPSWYETTKAVPTWNYVAIHVYGELTIIKDELEIHTALNDLVEKYERPDSPYNLNVVDTEYIEGLTRGIVPFKINISSIEAKAKLSQNHPRERQKAIADQLAESSSENDRQLADLMIKLNSLS